MTESLDIPTIGIGAGPDTDGQVLVFHDLLGTDEARQPAKFVRQYANLGPGRSLKRSPLRRGRAKRGRFPMPDEAYANPEEI